MSSGASRNFLLSLSTLVALSVVSVTPATHALDKEACGRSYLAAQQTRRAGSLLQSRKETLTCLQTCGPAATADCKRWLEDLEAAIPSALVVVTMNGRDADDVVVKIDGEPVTDLSRPVELDPGVHTLSVLAGQDRLEERFLLRESERGRRIEISLKPVDSGAPAVTTKPSPSAPAPEPPAGRTTWPVYVFGGLAVAGLATFGTFALIGKSKYQDLERCRPDCDQRDVDSTRLTYQVGDVGLAVGVVSLGIATYFLLRPASRRPSSSIWLLPQGVYF